MLKLRPKETASMLTRDGVRLDADIYRPEAGGTFPVLLMRQPYGRAIASTVVYAHPTWYAAHGYIVVIQDVRGRGTSEGNFKLFAHEINDGEDTVNWAANLPGSTGQVGMYGFSYQSMTQLYAAAAKPPALKTICPAMMAYDLFTDWAYEGGAFCLQANLGWALQIAAETARLKGDVVAHQALTVAAKNLTFSEAVSAHSEVLKTLDPDSFYHEWLEHSEPGAYWEQLSPNAYLHDVDLPMLHIGGWFDTFLRGTMRLCKEMAARSQYRQQLLVGPWAHLPWGRKVGAIDFGIEAASPCDRLQIRWFDQFLKGIDTGLLEEPAIALFEMGSNRWRTFDQWPTPNPNPYFLASTGLACMSDREGILTPTPHTPHLTPDSLVHDPWRPVPAHGGHAAVPSGPQERSSLDSRTDVLTYTSEPLTEDLPLVGEITVSIACTADTPSFDLCAILSEVKPNGSVYNFTQGYIRVPPGQATNPLHMKLQPTCICLMKGNALRLSLSAACFPAYPVNAGTGVAADKTRLIDQQVITVTVISGGDRPSHLLLPVLK
ncbi:MAG: CocE/NonD family hydrolase [Leptolyngbya sp. BL-A-14]